MCVRQMVRWAEATNTIQLSSRLLQGRNACVRIFTFVRRVCANDPRRNCILSIGTTLSSAQRVKFQEARKKQRLSHLAMRKRKRGERKISIVCVVFNCRALRIRISSNCKGTRRRRCDRETVPKKGIQRAHTHTHTHTQNSGRPSRPRQVGE